ncbi:MAG: hypothetical protein FJ086_06170 [Deltaproteobacteria bacterium]|nr:hypothetical protein [Deltaproteobacteria bacterium]
MTLTACKSAAEKLVEKRTELRAQEDALYRAYGGGDIANAVNGLARKDDAPSIPFGDLIGNAARDADRTAFIEDCVRVGNGDRPTLLSDKARTYFATPEGTDGCRKLATLNAEMAELTKAAARP